MVAAVLRRQCRHDSAPLALVAIVGTTGPVGIRGPIVIMGQMGNDPSGMRFLASAVPGWLSRVQPRGQGAGL